MIGKIATFVSGFVLGALFGYAFGYILVGKLIEIIQQRLLG